MTEDAIQINPNELREATWNDISTKDKEGNVTPIPDVEFYIQSFHTNNYERYVTTHKTNLLNILPFKKEHRLLIKK